MYRKKVFYYGGFLILLVLTCVLASADLIHRRVYLQSQVESALPQRPRQNANEKIRVLIKSKGFTQITHTEVTLQASSGLKLINGEVIGKCEPGQSITVTPNDERFQTGTIQVESLREGEKITIASLERGYGVPSYRGKLELYQTTEGIVIVNELLLEEYLYAVVPSEMPASYEL